MIDPQLDGAPPPADADHASTNREPRTDELVEPSAEREPGEEPTAPHPAKPSRPEVQEPSHHAVGIGVIDDGSV